MRIGILAVQGAFIEHEKILTSLGHECVELRQKSDITNIDGLVLPGGESTVQGKLLRDLDMFDDIRARIDDGIPVLATCAGLILLSFLDSNNLGSRCAAILIRVELRGRDALNDRERRFGLRLGESVRKGWINFERGEVVDLAVHTVADNDCTAVLVRVEFAAFCVHDYRSVILFFHNVKRIHRIVIYI